MLYLCAVQPYDRINQNTVKRSNDARSVAAFFFRGDAEMTGEEIKSPLKTYNLQSWSRQKSLNPIPVEKAEGIYFWDYDGNRYTDMSSQLVNMNLGFGNKAIGDAIKAQVDKYCFVGPSFGDEARAKLAKKIIGLMPDNMGKVFFTNAGADAKNSPQRCGILVPCALQPESWN